MTSLQSRERRGTVPRNSLNNGPSYIIHFGVDAPMDGGAHTQASSLRHQAVSMVSSTAALRSIHTGGATPVGPRKNHQKTYVVYNYPYNVRGLLPIDKTIAPANAQYNALALVSACAFDLALPVPPNFVFKWPAGKQCKRYEACPACEPT